MCFFCTSGFDKRLNERIFKMGLFDKIFGTYSDRELKKVTPIADKVMSYEEAMAAL